MYHDRSQFFAYFVSLLFGVARFYLCESPPIRSTGLLNRISSGICSDCLIAHLHVSQKRLSFTAHTKHFFIIGLFNTAAPFLFFAYAAQTLNASTLSILNSTAPIWGALIGFIWYRSPLTKAILGMAIGITGVAVLVGWSAVKIGEEAILPIIASLLAACSYGIATNYTKNAPQIPAFNNAHGSMWAAVIWVLPLLPFYQCVQSQPV